MQATWIPHEKHGRLTKQSDLPEALRQILRVAHQIGAQDIKKAAGQTQSAVCGDPEVVRSLVTPHLDQLGKEQDRCQKNLGRWSLHRSALF
jgi:hypothetical protein